jgi:hypothetical protein
MPQIRVDPAELEQVAGEVKGAASLLEALSPRIRQLLSQLNWESGPKPIIEAMGSLASAQAGGLNGEAGALAQFLTDRAAAFRTADEAGSTAASAVAERHPAFFHPAVHTTAPPAPTGTRLPTSAETRYIQAVLGVTGEEGYGPKTQAAVRELQALHGIPVDPQVQIGPRTWSLLQGQQAAIAGEGAPVIPAAGPMLPRVPYLSQWNSPWAEVKVGPTETYRQIGCTLTDMAMLVQYNRPDVQFDAKGMAELAQRANVGTDLVHWSAANEYLQEKWGLSLEHHDLDGSQADRLTGAMARAYQSLEQGQPVVVGVQNGENQHWVVIRGYQGEGAPSDPAQFLIHDPANPSRKSLADLLQDPKYQGGNLQAVFRLTKSG